MKIDYRNIQKTFRAASIMEAARSCLSILVTEVQLYIKLNPLTSQCLYSSLYASYSSREIGVSGAIIKTSS